VIICLLEHGADVNIKDNVSTATSGVAVMVEMLLVVVRDEMVMVVVCDWWAGSDGGDGWLWW
jgi:hypothetical protein